MGLDLFKTAQDRFFEEWWGGWATYALHSKIINIMNSITVINTSINTRGAEAGSLLIA